MLDKAAPSGSPQNAVTSRKLRIAVADLTDAALLQTFDVGAPFLPTATDEPYNGVWGLIMGSILVPTEFSGGGSTAVTVEVGIVGALDLFVGASNVFTGGALSIAGSEDQADLAAGSYAGSPPMIAPTTGPFQIVATVRSDVNVNLLTDGECTVYVNGLEVIR